jgi:hypothetical protein
MVAATASRFAFSATLTAAMYPAGSVELFGSAAANEALLEEVVPAYITHGEIEVSTVLTDTPQGCNMVLPLAPLNLFADPASSQSR